MRSIKNHTVCHFFSLSLVTPAEAGAQGYQHSVRASWLCHLRDLVCSPGSPLSRGRQIWGILLAFLLTCCEEKHPIILKKPTPTIAVKDPVGVFCGLDCSGCKFNADKCLSLVKANLPVLCNGGANKNCYTLWLQYAKTCQSLCGISDKTKTLADEKKFTRIGSVEGSHPL